MSNDITKNRYIAFLDIMGVKKLLETEGVAKVYSLYSEIDDITLVYKDLLFTRWRN